MTTRRNEHGIKKHHITTLIWIVTQDQTPRLRNAHGMKIAIGRPSDGPAIFSVPTYNRLRMVTQYVLARIRSAAVVAAVKTYVFLLLVFLRRKDRLCSAPFGPSGLHREPSSHLREEQTVARHILLCSRRLCARGTSVLGRTHRSTRQLWFDAIGSQDFGLFNMNRSRIRDAVRGFLWIFKDHDDIPGFRCANLFLAPCQVN